MALNETLHCPACNYTADEFFSECPKCGVIVHKYYKSLESKKERDRIHFNNRATSSDTTQKVHDALKVGGAGFLSGAVMALLGICVGIGLMMIPVVGWVIGPLVILGSLFFPIMTGAFGIKAGIVYSGGTTLKGPCPYCGGLVDVITKKNDKGKVLGVDCPICRKRFVVKQQSFYPV